jgi:hypothetical protein
MPYTKRGLLATISLLAPGLVLAQAPGADAPQNPQVAQSADDKVAQYDALLKQTEGLEVYNQLVQRQIQNQQQDLQNIRAAIDQVPDLERQIPPLLSRMIDGLKEFVRLDIPFHPDERADRIADLETMMERSDVTDAEKLRRIMEAWEVEIEYGNTPEAYVGQLTIDGQDRQVEFLRLGRISWIYQTNDDESLTGIWDANAKSWVPLGSQYRNSVRQAIRMARNQVAPDLVLVPVPPPQTE